MFGSVFFVYLYLFFFFSSFIVQRLNYEYVWYMCGDVCLLMWNLHQWANQTNFKS